MLLNLSIIPRERLDIWKSDLESTIVQIADRNKTSEKLRAVLIECIVALCTDLLNSIHLPITNPPIKPYRIRRITVAGLFSLSFSLPAESLGSPQTKDDKDDKGFTGKDGPERSLIALNEGYS
jgi:hypothetical protein